ncbi:MBL fold metallo-hydrolase [Patescibacteria group bacterium]|nr:MBL fold metallo-hydrolase [Patescibacteria group bacterium]
MEIKYFGYFCFRIKGKDAVLVTDPIPPSLGLKLPPIMADIVVVSGKGAQGESSLITKAVSRENPFVIEAPGEYEIGGSFILGLQAGTNNHLFVITIDGLRLAFLGGLTDSLSDRQLEEIDGVDILFLPVGLGKILPPKKAADLVGQIDPKIIIPMAYKIPGLNLDLAPLSDFLKEMGIEQANPQEKLIISKDKLPLEKEVVVLNAKS